MRAAKKKVLAATMRLSATGLLLHCEIISVRTRPKSQQFDDATRAIDNDGDGRQQEVVNDIKKKH